MKKNFTLYLGLLIAISTSIKTFAQTEKANAYFTTSEMPDMLKWYQAPPKEDSEEFIRDVKRYYWGKKQRLNPERASIAVRDARYGLATIIREFSVPFGLQISRQNTPDIYTLLRDALATCDSICKIPKQTYMRQRPFVFFSEHTLTPEDEASLRKNGSYPSGHTILGWSAALLLSEINPEAEDTLLARGIMFGESRVIVGAHWQSDIDAGFHAASVAYMKLHTNELFLKQMEEAKKEFLNFKGKYPPLESGAISNDSTYLKYKKERANMKEMEQRFNCKILRYPYEFDETTKLKMLYIKTNECPYAVANGVDNIILINESNEMVYVVHALLRHDKKLDDEGKLYGLYVVDKDTEGEIEISDFDFINLQRLLFQYGSIPELLNCTSIKFEVAGVPYLIPFSPITEYNRKKYQRFFRN